MNWVAYDKDGKEIGRHFTLEGLFLMMRDSSPHYGEIQRLEKEDDNESQNE